MLSQIASTMRMRSGTGSWSTSSRVIGFMDTMYHLRVPTDNEFGSTRECCTCSLNLRLPMVEKLGNGKTDVSSDLSKKEWRDVATCVEGDGSCAARVVTELLVRTTLPYLSEAQALQNRHDLGGFENGDIAHDSGDRYVLNSHEFRFKYWFAVFKEHRNNFAKIGVQLVER